MVSTIPIGLRMSALAWFNNPPYPIWAFGVWGAVILVQNDILELYASLLGLLGLILFIRRIK